MSIEKTKFGKYRIQVWTGHKGRLQILQRKEFLSPKEEKEIETLQKILTRPSGRVLGQRRSANTVHLWQAMEIDEAFIAASAYERQGKKPPPSLTSFDICPERDQYIEETSFALATTCGMNTDIIGRMDFEMFCAQADINVDWIKSLDIPFHILQKAAKNLCEIESEKISFKNKKFLFIGAPKTITSSLVFLRCLKTMAEDLKVDGIITTGPWIRTIFLHKQSKFVEIPKEVKDLASNFNFYAMRSNKDRIERMQPLKAIGIKFLRGIEREHFSVTGLTFQQSSTRDQLKRFEYENSRKDILCSTTYVAARSRPNVDGEYSLILGSGSSGTNTPRSRHWANSYDSQMFNASIRDSIGGHILHFDEKERMYPTTFRFEEKQQAIFFGGKIYSSTKVADANMHVILTDLHVLSNSTEGFWAFIDFLRNNKKHIKSLTLNGDFFSNHVISHHQEKDIKLQAEIKAEGMSFLKEVSIARDYLDRIIKELEPGIKKFFKMGNHEKNSIKTFLSKSTNHFLDDMMDLDTLMGLTKKGFTIIENHELHHLHDMTIIHGNELQTVEARKLAGPKIVKGHSHLLDISTDGVALPGMEDPSKAGYLPTKYVKWAIGWGVSTEYKGVMSLPHPMLVRHGKYFDFNKIKKIKIKKLSYSKALTVEYKINI